MKATLAVIFTLCLSGCASLDTAMTGVQPSLSHEQREKIAKEDVSLSTEEKEKFVAGQPWIGMSVTHLNALWNNSPKKSQSKLTDKGNENIFIYQIREGDWQTGVQSKYFKVKALEGKVTEIQQLDQNLGSYDQL